MTAGWVGGLLLEKKITSQTHSFSPVVKHHHLSILFTIIYHFFRVSTKYVPTPACGLSVRVNHNCLIKAMDIGCLWLKESNIPCWYGTYWEQKNTDNPPSIAIN